MNIVKTLVLALVLSSAALIAAKMRPLHHAVMSGDTAAIEALLKKGVVFDDEIRWALIKPHNDTYYACLQKMLDYRALLVAQKRISPVLNIEFCYYDAPQDVRYVELFLTRSDLVLHPDMRASMVYEVVQPVSRDHANVADDVKAAIIRNKLQSLQLLLAHGADVTMKNPKQNNRLPLESALCGYYYLSRDHWYSSDLIVEALLAAGADVYAKDPESGYTLLHRAVEGGPCNRGAIRLLIERGVPINAHASAFNNQDTALHIAAENGYYILVQDLLEHGASPLIPDSNGCTPLHAALRHSTYYGVAVLLMERGADVFIKDGQGRTAWDLYEGDARDEKSRGLVECFIKHGMDVNAVAADGTTALHRAAAVGSYVTVHELIAHGAALDMQDTLGNTPIQRAIQSLGQSYYTRAGEVVKLLRNAGANLTLCNHEGIAPIDVLVAQDRAEEIARHYGKSLSALRAQNAQLDAVLRETWWDLYFFNIKAFFQAPSVSKIKRMSEQVRFLSAVSDTIAECIEDAKKSLAQVKDPTCIDSGNIGLDITANILMLQWLLVSGVSASRQKYAIESAIKIMVEARNALQERIKHIQALIHSF